MTFARPCMPKQPNYELLAAMFCLVVLAESSKVSCHEDNHITENASICDVSQQYPACCLW